jgi:hypothetical protein
MTLRRDAGFHAGLSSTSLRSMTLTVSDASVEFIDHLVRYWGAVVVPFFAPGKSKTAARIFGSGFIVHTIGGRWLVTALHVVEDIVRLEACVINVAGQGPTFGTLDCRWEFFPPPLVEFRRFIAVSIE